MASLKTPLNLLFWRGAGVEVVEARF